MESLLSLKGKILLSLAVFVVARKSFCVWNRNSQEGETPGGHEGFGRFLFADSATDIAILDGIVSEWDSLYYFGKQADGITRLLIVGCRD